MTTRVGVVSDTHCPEFLARLPDRLFEVLDGVDLILHAGDVGGESTLRELERIAPVKAVRGDHDQAMTSLHLTEEIVIEGKRIVLVHGNRSHWIEEPGTLLWTLSLGHYRPHKNLPALLRRRFGNADAIVYGHTHRARSDVIDGTLVFNPGAVHQWNPQTTRARLKEDPGWFEWCWLQVAQHLRVYPGPTVGILEIDSQMLKPAVAPL